MANAKLKLIIACMAMAAFLLLTASAGSPRRALMTATQVAEFLRPQNAARARLGLPPFQWDFKLANYAKLYARQRQGDCALVHSSGDLGENIFWGQGKKWSISAAVSTWITTEEPYYNYNKNSCAPNADCTHYTQIVWRTSLYVGCAKVICNSGDTFLTCNYFLHGNIIGSRPY